MSNAETGLIESLPRETLKLGKPERVHRALCSLAAPTAIAILATGLILLGFGALFVYSGLYAPMKNATPEALIGAGVFFAVLGVALVGTALQYHPPSMKPGEAGAGGYVVFEDALAFCDGNGWRIVRWDDVEEMLNPGGRGDYRLVTRQAQSVPIEHSVKGYDALIARVFEEVVGRLVPRVLQAVEKGETIHFGSFALGREALTYQGKTLAWNLLGTFTIVVKPGQGRQLRIRTKGGLHEWCLVPLDPIPSAEVFLQAARTIHEAWLLDPNSPVLVR